MTYPGGKEGAGVFQRIICQMPPHRVYVEAFLGDGAVMRHKLPAVVSIGIDRDGDVIQRWRIRSTSSPPNLTLLQTDALEWLGDHIAELTDDTMLYLDPPYLMSTRRDHRQLYRYELSDADHARLLDIITRLDCMVMVSGYWSQLYAEALAGWRTVTYSARTRGGSVATEWLWMNYPEPLELHDYRYLGEGFRKRESIKRKKNRWLAKLRAMPTLERYAIMEAIRELRQGATPLDSGAAPEAARAPESPGRPTSDVTMLDHDLVVSARAARPAAVSISI